MGFLDKAKAAAEQAASKAKEGVQDVQTKRELSQAYGELGQKTTYSLENAKRRVGWSPRPLEETIVDCARSLLGQGARTVAAGAP